MSFFDQRFPECVSYGAQGGPVWSTTQTKLSSGVRFANRNRMYPLHKYEVSQGIKTETDFARVRDFFYVVYGAFDAFRYKDWADYKAAQHNSALSQVSGSDWQLLRRYTFGVRTFDRLIKKPVAGTVQVWRTRAGTTSQASATVDYASGIASISGHVSGDTYTWSGEFDVPVYFETDQMMVEIVNASGASGEYFLSWASVPLAEEVPA